MATRHVYGPVPSRRLGLSLGIDTVTFKSCPFDCIYCQLGSTATHTTERRHFVEPAQIVAELRDKLAQGPRPDFITLGGSGEPTLALELAELISAIKNETDIPVALLSGGALFHLPEVRAAARLADLILPSLDAGDDELFALVNRPDPSLCVQAVIEGLVALRQEYSGGIWLEVMMLAGISDRPDRLVNLVRAVRRIAPDKVQLNTPVRPADDERVKPMTPAALAALCDLFVPVAEVIADFPLELRWHAGSTGGLSSQDVVTVLARRPCMIGRAHV